MTLPTCDLTELWSRISPRPLKLEAMSPSQRANLKTSLRKLNRRELWYVRSARNIPVESPPTPISPLKTWLSSSSPELAQRGCELLRAGKVGIVILAGGNGSRLGGNLPKGMVPLSNVLGRPLFQILVEKLVAAQSHYSAEFPLVVLTSKRDLQQTTRFFRDRAFWGLKPEKVHFVAQGEFPILTLEGDPLIGPDGSLVHGPNGNGSMFHELAKSGAIDQFTMEGITHISVQPIDNPLADPVNPALIGAVQTGPEALQNSGSPLCFKAVERLGAAEALGIFAVGNRSPRVIEYFELVNLADQLIERLTDVETAGLSNTGEFCISLRSAVQIADVELNQWPLHLAKKCIPSIRTSKPRKPNGFKAEYFNFDILHWIDRAEVMLFDRATAFAPLKESRGCRGVHGVRAALQSADRYQYELVSHRQAPERAFELSANWFYSSGSKQLESPIYRPISG